MNSSAVNSTANAATGSPRPMDQDEVVAPVNDQMDIDVAVTSGSQMVNDELVRVQKLILSYSTSLDNLKVEEAGAFSMSAASVDEMNTRRLVLERIQFDTNYVQTQLNNAIGLLRKLEKTSIEDSLESKALSLKGTSPRDSKVIPSRELPVFDVRPQPLIDGSEMPKNDVHSLKSFITRFERVFKDHNMNVEFHWEFSLEACSESTCFAGWYAKNIKAAYTKSKGKMSWVTAKEVLKHRFEFANNMDDIQVNVLFANLRQKVNETLAEYMDRYNFFSVSAKVQNKNCLALTGLFIASLFSLEFQKKVHETMINFYKQYRNSDNTAHGSIYAPDNNLGSFYQDFDQVVIAINSNMAELERDLIEIKKSMSSRGGEDKSSQVKSAPKESSLNANNKRVKTTHEPPVQESTKGEINYDNVDFTQISNTSYDLNKDERAYMRYKRKCMACRVATFSLSHAQECA